MPSQYISSLPLLLKTQWMVEGYVFMLPGDTTPAGWQRIGRLPEGILLAASNIQKPPAELKPWPLRYQNEDGSPLAFVETTSDVSIYVELVSFRTGLDQPDDAPVWCVFRLAQTHAQTHLCDD